MIMLNTECCDESSDWLAGGLHDDIFKVLLYFRHLALLCSFRDLLSTSFFYWQKVYFE